MNAESSEDYAVQAVLWEPESTPPTAEKFRDVGPNCRTKPPHGTGLWTSTYLGPDKISGWAEWCRNEQFGCGEHRLWLLTVKPDTNVITIDSYDDLRRLHLHTLDWQCMASNGVDGIHLTDEGQWATRLTHPLDLYGWDCESTIWFRWAFSQVEDGGLVEVEARGYVFEEAQ